MYRYTKILLLIMGLALALGDSTTGLHAHPIEPGTQKVEAEKSNDTKQDSRQQKPSATQDETLILWVFGGLSILGFLTFIVLFSLGLELLWFWGFVVFLGLDLVYTFSLWYLSIYSEGSGGLSDLARGVPFLLSFLVLFLINLIGGIVFLILGLAFSMPLIWLGAVGMILMGLFIVALSFNL